MSFQIMKNRLLTDCHTHGWASLKTQNKSRKQEGML
jgi:hypothetical protein